MVLLPLTEELGRNAVFKTVLLYVIEPNSNQKKGEENQILLVVKM